VGTFLSHTGRERGGQPSEGQCTAVSRAERHVRNATTEFPLNGAHGLLVHSVLSAQMGLALRLLPKNEENAAAAACFVSRYRCRHNEPATWCLRVTEAATPVARDVLDG
jgi:hypothetical protein